MPATALAYFFTGCAQQTFMTKTNQPVAPRNHHLFLRFWNWAEENCRATKFVAENVVKQKP